MFLKNGNKLPVTFFSVLIREPNNTHLHCFEMSIFSRLNNSECFTFIVIGVFWRHFLICDHESEFVKTGNLEAYVTNWTDFFFTFPGDCCIRWALLLTADCIVADLQRPFSEWPVNTWFHGEFLCELACGTLKNGRHQMRVDQRWGVKSFFSIFVERPSMSWVLETSATSIMAAANCRVPRWCDH